jgi:hypothetical protein
MAPMNGKDRPMIPPGKTMMDLAAGILLYVKTLMAPLCYLKQKERVLLTASGCPELKKIAGLWDKDQQKDERFLW